MNILNVNNIMINKDFIESIEIYDKDFSLNDEENPDDNFYVIGTFNNITNTFNLNYKRERVTYTYFLNANPICNLNVSSIDELKKNFKKVLQDWYYFEYENFENFDNFEELFNNSVFTMYEKYATYKILIRKRFLKEIYITMASGKEHKFFKRKDVEIILKDFENNNQLKIQEC